MVKSNKELSLNQNTTPRQISKSRKRGWIFKNNDLTKRYKYTAPNPLVWPDPKNKVKSPKKGFKFQPKGVKNDSQV